MSDVNKNVLWEILVSRIKSLFLPSFIITLVFIPSILDAAGTAQIPQTGFKASYYVGDDGYIRAGVGWPDKRFTDNANETVTDNLSGLIWTKNGNLMETRDSYFDNDDIEGDGKVVWQHALDYIAELNSDKYLGYNDWRLPNRKELRSLADYSRINPALNEETRTVFMNVHSGYYWSSSTYAEHTFQAWYIHMGDGGVVNSSKLGYGYVWPVRAGQCGSSQNSVICLPQTGVTKCYDENGDSRDCLATGEDGELKNGLEEIPLRFTNPDGTTVLGDIVLDNQSGLMWTKDAALTEPIKWEKALDYVALLNSSEYLGYSDWRLPNVNELESLINAGEPETAIWLDAQGFSNVQTSFYWSSSTYAGNSIKAWSVNVNHGYLHEYHKYSSRYVWPVRAGQIEPFDSSRLADITMPFLKVPGKVKRGKKIKIKSVVRNEGDAKASNFEIVFYLTKNKSLYVRGGEIFVKRLFVRSIHKNDSRKFVFKVKMPSVSKGKYAIKAVCDSDNGVEESNKGNNVRVSKRIRVK